MGTCSAASGGATVAVNRQGNAPTAQQPDPKPVISNVFCNGGMLGGPWLCQGRSNPAGNRAYPTAEQVPANKYTNCI